MEHLAEFLLYDECLKQGENVRKQGSQNMPIMIPLEVNLYTYKQ